MNKLVDYVPIVSNPNAGPGSRGEILHELIACLGMRGLRPDLVSDIEALPTIVARSQAEGRLRAVIAAGGDGTVAEVVNRTEPGVPVTVFPLGTANLLAHYLEIRCDPRSMAQLLSEGVPVQVDAARANDRIFLLMAGCGFDADVVQRLHRRRSGRSISYWTWVKPILDAIRRYRFPKLQVYCDLKGSSSPWPHDGVRWVFVVNLPVYAGGLCIAPRAVGNDGMLDVCTFAKGSVWHGFRYLGRVATRRHGGLNDYNVVAATRVRIESDEPVPYQLDGDPGGLLPVEIEVLPKRLTLWMSSARASALGLHRVADTEA